MVQSKQKLQDPRSSANYYRSDHALSTPPSFKILDRDITAQYDDDAGCCKILMVFKRMVVAMKDPPRRLILLAKALNHIDYAKLCLVLEAGKFSSKCAQGSRGFASFTHLI
jgi:hypothetical protein